MLHNTLMLLLTLLAWTDGSDQVTHIKVQTGRKISGTILRCIPQAFWCDYERDCDNGWDERNCPDWLSRFTKTGNKKILNGIRETFISNPQGCAKQCLFNLQCASFSYDGAKQTCHLGYVNRAILRENAGSDYYVLTASISSEDDCKGKYLCGNKKCLDRSVLCNGKDDCSDNSDEQDCSKISQCGTRVVEEAAKDPRKPLLARIVGGFTTAPGAYPWQAAIRRKPSSHWCGASIVSPRALVTAAHCFKYDQSPRFYNVVVGQWDRKANEATRQVFDIEQIITHPDYREIDRVPYRDIAIIKIKPKYGKLIQVNDNVQPICLPNRNANYTQGRKCVISGWGETGTSYARKLQAAEIPIISRENCTQGDVYGNRVRKGTFCAGFLRGGVDSCQGDSGSPFACKVDGRFYLYGITSWGDGCAKPNKPGVYTRVADYADWIHQYI